MRNVCLKSNYVSAAKLYKDASNFGSVKRLSPNRMSLPNNQHIKNYVKKELGELRNLRLS